MLRRTAFTLLAVVALAAGRAEAVTIRDVIELSKAGLSEQVLLALIEVDRSVFAIDTATIKQLKEAGVTDPVIVALIKSGRARAPEPVPAPIPTDEPEPRREPQVVVIDHHDAPAPAPVAVPYPVAVPVYLNSPLGRFDRRDTVTQTIETDHGLVKARLPVPQNCVKAEPVFWGFGGKLRPDSWQPAPTVLCR
jgi:hypothetical protein